MIPTYQYAGLQNVKRPGLRVAESAARLHHLAYAEERLMFLQAAHLVTTPEWDVKILLGRLQYEASQHADRLKARLIELRLSKKKANAAPDSLLKIVFDEAMHAAGTVELLAGVARVFIPALLEAYRNYIAETNDLADYPTVRLLRAIIPELEEGLELLEAAYQDIVDTPEKEAEAGRWIETLHSLLNGAGGIDGSGEINPEAVRPVRATTPYVIPRQIARDDTFPRVWDFIHVENEQVAARLAQMISTRLSEITAAEGLTYVLCETQGQPWAFYADISRHLWDEVRHTLFGEAATEDLFDDRSAMPIRVFDETYVTQMTPLEQYAALGLGIEAAMMKYPPGKREEFEFCRDTARYPLLATLQDFDWADEVLHVNIARRQLKEWFEGDQNELLALAQQGVDRRNQIRAMRPQEELPDLGYKVGQAQGPAEK